LANGSTFTVTINATAPASTGTCLTNTASVIGNERDPERANNASSVQTCTGVGCSSKPPKVNVRWHYSVNGSSGSWSGTREAKCGQTITMGPQAMEGDLKVSPGAAIKAGYDFTL